jgi:enoyl-CoA hydratase/3-hydroxyacyl-CoA dehydrogenase
VAPVGDIDEAVQLGGGFPEGPAKMADSTGIDSLIETLESAASETDATRYAVADGLQAASDAGGFYVDDDEAVEYENLTVDHPREYVARITLDRPHRMNTISPDLLDELSTAIDELSEDPDARAILLQGAGDRAFSAGADVQSMTSNATPQSATKLSRNGQGTFGKLESCPMPVVAAIDGFALGGGMELATCADLRIAAEGSELGQPEHNLGLLPGWGGTQRLKHIVGEGRAKEIIFTADRFSAAEMADYGFINEVVDPDEFEARALELAEELAHGPPIAQELTKQAMLAGRDDTDAGLEVEAQSFGHLINTDDLMEGVMAFVNDEEPEFEGT